MWTIPLSIGAKALGWVGNNLHWILLAALLAVSFAFSYAKGRAHERDRWKPKVEALTDQILDIRRDYENAAALAREEQQSELERVRQLTRSTEENYEAKLQASNARADAVLSELRRARAASRVRPLAPSAAAPTACRDYEADPTRLSDSDVEFLVGEARVGAACVEQLAACSAYAVNLHAVCSGRGDPREQ